MSAFFPLTQRENCEIVVIYFRRLNHFYFNFSYRCYSYSSLTKDFQSLISLTCVSAQPALPYNNNQTNNNNNKKKDKQKPIADWKLDRRRPLVTNVNYTFALFSRVLVPVFRTTWPYRLKHSGALLPKANFDSALGSVFFFCSSWYYSPCVASWHRSPHATCSSAEAPSRRSAQCVLV